MARKRLSQVGAPPLARSPEQRKPGDEPMTQAQRAYLETLERETGEDLDPHMTKAQASEKIDARQNPTGRESAGRPQSSEIAREQVIRGQGRRKEDQPGG